MCRRTSVTSPLCALLKATHEESGLISLIFAFVTRICRWWGTWCDFEDLMTLLWRILLR